MVSEDLKNRAETLVANAHGTEIESHDLITLADDRSSVYEILKNDRNTTHTRGFLTDKPVINYFAQDEQPHYLLYNESIGVSIGNSRKKSDIGEHHQNTMWVTDKGIHFAIGRSEEDFHKFIPFNKLENIKQEGNSLLTMEPHTFIFHTTEDSDIEFVTDSGLDKKEAYDFIDKQISNSPSPKNDASIKPSVKNKNRSVQSSDGISETDLATLQKVDEYDFEKIVSKIWEKQGWTTEVTGGSGDRGIDIKAEKEDPFHQLQYIQAKRYSESNKVGSSEIQKYAGLHVREETVDAVIVVTTSGFTTEAEKVAKNRNVKIINGSQLMRMICEYDIEV